MKNFNKLNVEGRINLCYWALQKRINEDPLSGMANFAGDITNSELLGALEAASVLIDYCKFEIGEDIDPQTNEHLAAEKGLPKEATERH